MVGLIDASKNLMLDALGIDTVSLHTGDPGAAGTANELTGGTYARKAITMNAAAAGNLDSSNTPVFDVPAGNTITHVGYWDATVFRGSMAITSETYAAAGTYTLNDFDLNLNK